MKTKNSGRGEPVESMCLVAGTGSSVLDPFPSVVVASLRAVDHRCCTPLPCGVVVVETVALNPLVQGVTHTHTHTMSHLFTPLPPLPTSAALAEAKWFSLNAARLQRKQSGGS